MPGRRAVLSSRPFRYGVGMTGDAFGLPGPEERREAAQEVIDTILHDVAQGSVDRSIGQNLRQKILMFPGEPDRALLEHLRDQFQQNGMDFDGVVPEDLD